MHCKLHHYESTDGSNISTQNIKKNPSQNILRKQLRNFHIFCNINELSCTNIYPYSSLILQLSGSDENNPKFTLRNLFWMSLADSFPRTIPFFTASKLTTVFYTKSYIIRNHLQISIGILKNANSNNCAILSQLSTFPLQTPSYIYLYPAKFLTLASAIFQFGWKHWSFNMG